MTDVDAIVVGAGILGAFAADALAEAAPGARVLCVDPTPPGHGTTRWSVGFVPPLLRTGTDEERVAVEMALAVYTRLGEEHPGMVHIVDTTVMASTVPAGVAGSVEECAAGEALERHCRHLVRTEVLDHARTFRCVGLVVDACLTAQRILEGRSGSVKVVDDEVTAIETADDHVTVKMASGRTIATRVALLATGAAGIGCIAPHIDAPPSHARMVSAVEFASRFADRSEAIVLLDRDTFVVSVAGRRPVMGCPQVDGESPAAVAHRQAAHLRCAAEPISAAWSTPERFSSAGLPKIVHAGRVSAVVGGNGAGVRLAPFIGHAMAQHALPLMAAPTAATSA